MVKLTTLQTLEYQVTGKSLYCLTVPAKYNGQRWYIEMEEKTSNAIDTMLELHDQSLYQEWLGYKEGGMSSEGFAFQERLETLDGMIGLEDGSELVLSEQVTAPELTTIPLEEPTKQEIQKALDQLLKEASKYHSDFLGSIEKWRVSSSESNYQKFNSRMTLYFVLVMSKRFGTIEEIDKELQEYEKALDVMRQLLEFVKSHDKYRNTSHFFVKTHSN
jgi:hypothetical protein